MDLGSQLVATSPLGQAARALVPLIDEHGEYADREGRLHDDVVDAFHRDGLYQMWVPEVLGGSELDPLHSLETLEIASYGDPSAGWVLMASCLAIGTAGSYLADDAVAELWADGQRPVIAGQGTRPGTAVPHEDGFLVSGSWSFASGLLHGTHIHTLAVITTTGEPRIFVVPVEKASLLGNWDVLGLRGTGSIDYTLDNVYVPDSYSHFAVVDEPRRGGALYRVGIIGFAAMCHSGWALGVGRRLLDELGALVNDKAGRAGARARQRRVPPGLRQGRSDAACGARARVRGLGRRVGHVARRRAHVGAPAHARAPCADERDERARRGLGLRVPRRRHDRSAPGHDPAARARRARRHAARHVIAGRVGELRARARRAGRRQALAVPRPR